jgi:CRP-like cAMP-binding protein
MITGSVPSRQCKCVATMASPLVNRLLALFPAAIYYQSPLFELDFVSLPFGAEIYGSGKTQEFVYFPTTAVISLLSSVDSGRSVEIGIVGNDGMVDVTVFMGGGSAAHRAVVQSAGGAFRIRSSTVVSLFKGSVIFQRILLRYTQSLIVQMSQTAICNRFHSTEQQLCRLLLLTHDRVPSNELVMTQELLADRLGVCREAISHEAVRLQTAGVISYRRGHIAILDRSGLEERVCECYGVVRAESDRLMSQIPYEDSFPRERFGEAFVTAGASISSGGSGSATPLRLAGRPWRTTGTL